MRLGRLVPAAGVALLVVSVAGCVMPNAYWAANDPDQTGPATIDGQRFVVAAVQPDDPENRFYEETGISYFPLAPWLVVLREGRQELEPSDAANAKRVAAAYCSLRDSRPSGGEMTVMDEQDFQGRAWLFYGCET